MYIYIHEKSVCEYYMQCKLNVKIPLIFLSIGFFFIFTIVKLFFVSSFEQIKISTIKKMNFR